jgi:hypothetical protein
VSENNDSSLVELDPPKNSLRRDRFIDLLLSVETSAQQQKFPDSISAIQDEAKRRFGSTLQKFAASQCDALLLLFRRPPKAVQPERLLKT